MSRAWGTCISLPRGESILKAGNEGRFRQAHQGDLNRTRDDCFERKPDQRIRADQPYQTKKQ